MLLKHLRQQHTKQKTMTAIIGFFTQILGPGKTCYWKIIVTHFPSVGHCRQKLFKILWNNLRCCIPDEKKKNKPTISGNINFN